MDRPSTSIASIALRQSRQCLLQYDVPEARVYEGATDRKQFIGRVFLMCMRRFMGPIGFRWSLQGSINGFVLRPDKSGRRSLRRR